MLHSTKTFTEPLQGLFTSSRWLTLDFANINPATPSSQNIQQFFAECEQQGINPRLPEHRQRFNNRVLDETGARYLVSRYGEDRSAMLAGSSIASERRTLHLGIDIFCRDQETVFAPSAGEIVATGREPQSHSFGHYLVFKPDGSDTYIFFGHLSAEPPLRRGRVDAGQAIARLGDYANGENGDWSRHLHIQLFQHPPLSELDLIGYSTKESFRKNSQRYPNPMTLFPTWRPQ
jgi:murein DD-endopeptidase MepM/ murein hydrolase activator NlpD